MKAIVLISGGLDSILAARVIKEQGIDIIPVNFYIPFYNRHKERPYKDAVSIVRDALGMGLKTIDISDDFLSMLKKPDYGFGSNMNPCIDCKILMLRRAKALMDEFEARFIVTGEVLGQRPMSQHRQALDIIAKKSGLEGLLLRPLSAKHLDETFPEKQGWIDRNKLLNFAGRGRRQQIELAGDFKIEGYPNPAGGCLLTDPEFSKKLKDLISHGQLNARNVELLKFGRHFRLSRDAKLVVGRNEKENDSLLRLSQNDDYCFAPLNTAGPTCLGVGNFDDKLISLSCVITSRYCDSNGGFTTSIAYSRISDKEKKIMETKVTDEQGIMNYHL